MARRSYDIEYKGGEIYGGDLRREVLQRPEASSLDSI